VTAIADAHERVAAPTLVTTTLPVGHVDRWETDLPSGVVLVEVESGWGVDWTYVALGAVIGAAILLAALLMTRGTGRHPPRGRPLTYG
jgi:hypothetical protein